jgi:uncharacterized membrane protein (UPF0127 family)
MVACASAPAASPPPFPSLPHTDVEVATQSGTHVFKVWIAADDDSRTQGLMHVRELPSDYGMLFLFEQPRPLAFWMKDTWLSLDLVFIRPDGTVVNVAAHARPLSLRPIESDSPAIAVLEVLAGTAERIGLRPGDRVALPTLRTTSTPAARLPAAPEGRAPD